MASLASTEQCNFIFGRPCNASVTALSVISTNQLRDNVRPIFDKFSACPSVILANQLSDNISTLDNASACLSVMLINQSK